ncbi:hypothetical protein C9374_014364 [Naegleria lovaniensis]|uniref:Uncharacterized protein n=1 Tax=Naegleria lovaniensis TaxID=51637 RepID=A0AA88GZS2_NAELO|nr:uncharacterized protein C9374_014364 [Naegleria lovaniensis]KAG2388964.1 hypothetical protein C9374_014364 [Naegleria lovaniensis]
MSQESSSENHQHTTATIASSSSSEHPTTDATQHHNENSSTGQNLAQLDTNPSTVVEQEYYEEEESNEPVLESLPNTLELTPVLIDNASFRDTMKHTVKDTVETHQQPSTVADFSQNHEVLAVASTEEKNHKEEDHDSHASHHQHDEVQHHSNKSFEEQGDEEIMESKTEEEKKIIDISLHNNDNLNLHDEGMTLPKDTDEFSHNHSEKECVTANHETNNDSIHHPSTENNSSHHPESDMEHHQKTHVVDSVHHEHNLDSPPAPENEIRNEEHVHENKAVHVEEGHIVSQEDNHNIVNQDACLHEDKSPRDHNHDSNQKHSDVTLEENSRHFEHSTPREEVPHSVSVEERENSTTSLHHPHQETPRDDGQQHQNASSEIEAPVAESNHTYVQEQETSPLEPQVEQVEHVSADVPETSHQEASSTEQSEASHNDVNDTIHDHDMHQSAAEVQEHASPETADLIEQVPLEQSTENKANVELISEASIIESSQEEMVGKEEKLGEEETSIQVSQVLPEQEETKHKEDTTAVIEENHAAESHIAEQEINVAKHETAYTADTEVSEHVQEHHAETSVENEHDREHQETTNENHTASYDDEPRAVETTCTIETQQENVHHDHDSTHQQHSHVESEQHHHSPRNAGEEGTATKGEDSLMQEPHIATIEHVEHHETTIEHVEQPHKHEHHHHEDDVIMPSQDLAVEEPQTETVHHHDVASQELTMEEQPLMHETSPVTQEEVSQPVHSSSEEVEEMEQKSESVTDHHHHHGTHLDETVISAETSEPHTELLQQDHHEKTQALETQDMENHKEQAMGAHEESQSNMTSELEEQHALEEKMPSSEHVVEHDDHHTAASHSNSSTSHEEQQAPHDTKHHHEDHLKHEVMHGEHHHDDTTKHHEESAAVAQSHEKPSENIDVQPHTTEVESSTHQGSEAHDHHIKEESNEQTVHHQEQHDHSNKHHHEEEHSSVPHSHHGHHIVENIDHIESDHSHQHHESQHEESGIATTAVHSASVEHHHVDTAHNPEHHTEQVTSTTLELDHIESHHESHHDNHQQTQNEQPHKDAHCHEEHLEQEPQQHEPHEDSTLCKLSSDIEGHEHSHESHHAHLHPTHENDHHHEHHEKEHSSKIVHDHETASEAQSLQSHEHHPQEEHQEHSVPSGHHIEHTHTDEHTDHHHEHATIAHHTSEVSNNEHHHHHEERNNISEVTSSVNHHDDKTHEQGETTTVDTSTEETISHTAISETVVEKSLNSHNHHHEHSHHDHEETVETSEELTTPLHSNVEPQQTEASPATTEEITNAEVVVVHSQSEETTPAQPVDTNEKATHHQETIDVSNEPEKSHSAGHDEHCHVDPSQHVVEENKDHTEETAVKIESTDNQTLVSEEASTGHKNDVEKHDHSEPVVEENVESKEHPSNSEHEDHHHEVHHHSEEQQHATPQVEAHHHYDHEETSLHAHHESHLDVSSGSQDRVELSDQKPHDTEEVLNTSKEIEHSHHEKLQETETSHDTEQIQNIQEKVHEDLVTKEGGNETGEVMKDLVDSGDHHTHTDASESVSHSVEESTSHKIEQEKVEPIDPEIVNDEIQESHEHPNHEEHTLEEPYESKIVTEQAPVEEEAASLPTDGQSQQYTAEENTQQFEDASAVPLLDEEEPKHEVLVEKHKDTLELSNEQPSEDLSTHDAEQTEEEREPAQNDNILDGLETEEAIQHVEAETSQEESKEESNDQLYSSDQDTLEYKQEEDATFDSNNVNQEETNEMENYQLENEFENPLTEEDQTEAHTSAMELQEDETDVLPSDDNVEVANDSRLDAEENVPEHHIEHDLVEEHKPNIEHHESHLVHHEHGHHHENHSEEEQVETKDEFADLNEESFDDNDFTIQPHETSFTSTDGFETNNVSSEAVPTLEENEAAPLQDSTLERDDHTQEHEPHVEHELTQQGHFETNNISYEAAPVQEENEVPAFEDQIREQEFTTDATQEFEEEFTSEKQVSIDEDGVATQPGESVATTNEASMDDHVHNSETTHESIPIAHTESEHVTSTHHDNTEHLTLDSEVTKHHEEALHQTSDSQAKEDDYSEEFGEFEESSKEEIVETTHHEHDVNCIEEKHVRFEENHGVATSTMHDSQDKEEVKHEEHDHTIYHPYEELSHDHNKSISEPLTEESLPFTPFEENNHAHETSQHKEEKEDTTAIEETFDEEFEDFESHSSKPVVVNDAVVVDSHNASHHDSHASNQTHTSSEVSSNHSQSHTTNIQEEKPSTSHSAVADTSATTKEQPEPIKEKTLEDVYIENCKKRDLRPNTRLRKQFADGSIVVDGEVNLFNNYLGDKGLEPFLETLLQLSFTKLSLPKQGLRNAGVQSMVEILKKHPTIVEVDLSSNLISIAGALALIDFAKTNSSIQKINVEGTYIDDMFKEKMEKCLSKNRPIVN